MEIEFDHHRPAKRARHNDGVASMTNIGDYAYHRQIESAADESDDGDGATGAPGSSSAPTGSGREEASALSKKRILNPFLSESDVASRCIARENHIYFFSGVSKESVYRMNEHLQKINQNFENLRRRNPTVNITPKPIYLHINSYGGGVFAAFAAIDFIKQSAIPVHTIVEGASASAATLMSVVGQKRYIRPHASMLIHQLRGWFGGKMTEIDDEYKNIEQMHQAIKNIYSKHTGIADERLDDLLKHDLWWTPEKCLKEKLVDAIWTNELQASLSD